MSALPGDLTTVLTCFLNLVALKVHRFKSDTRLKRDKSNVRQISNKALCSFVISTDSPPASNPYDMTSSPPIKNKVKVTFNISDSSPSSDEVNMQFDQSAIDFDRQRLQIYSDSTTGF